MRAYGNTYVKLHGKVIDETRDHILQIAFLHNNNNTISNVPRYVVRSDVIKS